MHAGIFPGPGIGLALLLLSLRTLDPSPTRAQDIEPVAPQIDVYGSVTSIDNPTLTKLIIQGVGQSNASCTSLGVPKASPCWLRWSIEPGTNRPPMAVLRVQLFDGTRVTKSVWSKMLSPGRTPKAAFLHDISRMTHALETQQEEAF